MKKSLLATVAAVALIAGTGLVSAESAKEQGGAPAAAVKSEPGMKTGADIKAGAAVKGKAETTGASAESKSEIKADSKADVKADTKANADKAKPSTTGQASDQKAAPAAKSSAEEKAPAAKSTTNEKAAPAASSTTQNTQSPAAKSTTQSQTSAPANSQTSASVSLTTEQKGKIRTTVLQSSSAPKVSRSQINFSLNIGTTVPRSVRFVTVPPTLVEIHPAWRGYSYFIVDDEIIIVDTSSMRIIAVLAV